MPANIRNRSAPSRGSSFCRPPSTTGGEASFKQVEPQVEEALFLERMQPELREYLTKLREEAYVEIKPGVVDTGASGNEMHLTYSAYTPPRQKRRRNLPAPASVARRGPLQVQTHRLPSPDTPGTDWPCNDLGQACNPAATTTRRRNHSPQPPRNRQAITIRTSEARQAREDPLWAGSSRVSSLLAGRHGQAPSDPDTNPSVTTPETRFVNPDGTVSSTAPAALNARRA